MVEMTTPYAVVVKRVADKPTVVTSDLGRVRGRWLVDLHASVTLQSSESNTVTIAVTLVEFVDEDNGSWIDGAADAEDFARFIAEKSSKLHDREVQVIGWTGNWIARRGEITSVEKEEAVDPPSHCPACGEPIDYCAGHGKFGDPTGWAILERHDDGVHDDCSSRGCDDKEETEMKI